MGTLILSGIAAAATTLLAAWSVFVVARRLDLEKKLKVALINDKGTRHRCAQKRLIQKLEQNPPDITAINEARELVVSMLQGRLTDRDRKKIDRGLQQDSLRGQADYIVRLLTGIGRCQK